jgi:hypothetical protein
MLRAQLLSAAALGAALIASPALAQRDNGAIEEMRREQANPGSAWVPQQRRAAAEADAMGRQDASRWLTEAEQALRRGRLGEANELLERAETRLLTRSTLASMADRPMQDPVVDRIAEARRALTARDRSGALSAIGGAQTALAGMPRDDMATGSGAGMAPAQGGGSWGGAIQDRGTAGSTMSRAVAIGPTPSDRRAMGSTLAQGGGGGGMGEGSGGLQGSTPGSPGVGMQGSTPSVRRETPQQPGQTSAVPGANVPGGAGAGSALGAGPTGAPSPGSGGIGVGTDQRGRTLTPTTPGASPSR